jgi:hypothetical protein
MVACCRLREGAQPQTPLLPLPLLRPCLPAGALLLPCPAALEDRVVAVAAEVAAWPPWGPKTPAGVEEAGEVEEEAGPVLPEPPPASSAVQHTATAVQQQQRVVSTVNRRRTITAGSSWPGARRS